MPEVVGDAVSPSATFAETRRKGFNVSQRFSRRLTRTATAKLPFQSGLNEPVVSFLLSGFQFFKPRPLTLPIGQPHAR